MLHQVAAPIGVAEGDHNWDFGFRYLWADFELSDEAHLTAEREVSYRHWSAGAQVQGFKVHIPFSMPHRGDFAAEVGVGRDGDFVVGSEGDPRMEWLLDAQPDTNSGWGRDHPYMGCFASGGAPALTGEITWGSRSQNLNIGFPAYGGGTAPAALNEAWMAAPSLELCDSLCADYRHFGLWWTQCLCGNTYGAGGATDGCGDQGSSCEPGQETCGGDAGHPVWQTGSPAWSLQHDVVAETKDRSTCWETLPALIPNPNTLSDIDGGTASSQGASYFTERFCPGWAKFVSSNSCLDSDPGCDASGSAIFDGGDDMCESRRAV